MSTRANPTGEPVSEAARTSRFAVIGAVLGALAVASYLLSLNGYVDPTGHWVGRDFLNLHVGGTLLNAGRSVILFDSAAYHEALGGLVGDQAYPPHYWSYPPLLFPVAQALALLPYPAAYLVWQVGGIVAVALASRALGLSTPWGLLVVLSPAGAVALLAGQNGLFVAALIGAGLATAARGRAPAAGFAWAVLAAKPHLGVAVVPMLFIQRQFLVVLWGGLFLILAIGATFLGYGAETWRLFLTETAAQQTEVVETWEGLLLSMMPTFFIQGRLWDLDTGSAYALQVAGIIVALPLLVMSRSTRKTDMRSAMTWLVVATFLALPYSFIYDMVVYQLMLALWHREPGRLFAMHEGKGAELLWGLAWFLPLIGFVTASAIHVQPVPFFLLFLLWRRVVATRERRPASTG